MKETCPCCDNPTLDARNVHDICPVCDWQDDPFQAENPTYAGGANGPSLQTARFVYQRLIQRKSSIRTENESVSVQLPPTDAEPKEAP